MAQRSLPSLFLEGLFSLNGRMGRSLFWLCMVSLTLSSILLAIGLTSLIRYAVPEFPRYAIYWILQLIILWPLFAVTVKRGHDRDRSIWWTLGVNIAGQLVPRILVETGRVEGGAWVWIVIGVYAFFEYGVLPGTEGPNRFGPPPER